MQNEECPICNWEVDLDLGTRREEENPHPDISCFVPGLWMPVWPRQSTYWWRGDLVHPICFDWAVINMEEARFRSTAYREHVLMRV